MPDFCGAVVPIEPIIRSAGGSPAQDSLGFMPSLALNVTQAGRLNYGIANRSTPNRWNDGKRGHDDLSGTCLEQRLRAFIHGRACREDVVHQQNRFALDLAATEPAYGERSAQVLFSLRRRQLGLIGSEPSLVQQRSCVRNSQATRQDSRHRFGLMMFLSQPPSPIARHRSHEIELRLFKRRAFIEPQQIRQRRADRLRV